MQQIAINENELATRWGVSPKTLQRWRSEGRGPRYLKLSKRVSYPLDEIFLFEERALHEATWERASDVVVTSNERLYSAQEVATATSLPLYLFTHPNMRKALEIPCIRVGKLVRFKLDEVIPLSQNSCRFQKLRMIRSKKRLFMKPNRKYHSAEFKAQALDKLHERGSRTHQDVANELNVPIGTLKNWLKESGKNHDAALLGDTPAASWSAAQRLTALNESYALKDQALHAWCREKGLFEHQLRQWHSEFCKIDKPAVTPVDVALRQEKQKNDQLERQLRRKDKALAEAAALLVLQKKFQALWGDEEK